MKWSKYNSTFDTDDKKHILYNCANDKILILTEELKTIIVQNDLDSIKLIHPEFYTCLVNNRFVIDDHIDDVNMAVENKESKLNREDYFMLTINPTLDCNLRCWYCYETHGKNSIVGEKTMDAIKNLLKNKIETPQLNSLFISFFGGEPLLRFNQTVRPLVNYAQELCNSYETKLGIGFTTNAVLLTSSVTDYLSSLGINVQIQVPFDGNKRLHDKVKRLPNGRSAYDLTLKNIKYAITKGLNFNIRCNYNVNNLESFMDLIDDFKDVHEKYFNSFYFSFQPIWQTHDGGVKTSPILKHIKSILDGLGMEHDGKIKKGSLGTTCYADRQDSVVVNYNGDVYKCTAQDFISEDREGVLNENGTITYNERYHSRVISRFSAPICQDCSILPICTICSQKKKNHPINTCPGNISEDEKLEKIQHRIKAISNNKITSA